MTVYIELEEGSAEPSFGAVDAEHLGGSIFKLSETFRSDFDEARFKPGTYVYCLQVSFTNEEGLKWVAYSELSGEAARYITKSE